MSAALPGRDAAPRMASYDDERARFGVVVPERFNPVVDILEGWAAEDPDALAVVSIDAAGEVSAQRTPGELAEDARGMARVLLELGIEAGDRVLIMLPRIQAWYTAMLGAIRIGAVPIPTPNLSTAGDIAYRVGAASAACVITDEVGIPKVEEGRAEMQSARAFVAVGRPRSRWELLEQLLADAGQAPLPSAPTASSDPLVIFFTSGTVAHPKMVLHPQSYGLGHVSTARFWHDLRAGDRHWTVSDTGWAKAAWGGLFGQWHERATVVQANLERPTADAILRTVERHAITSFCAPPTLYRLLVQEDLQSYDLSRLRHCTSAGEPLNPEVIRAWHEGTGGVTIYDGYGQSETTALVANYRAVEVRPGSMGKPIPGYDVAIVDDRGHPVEKGTVGNIVVGISPRPVGLFDEYLDNPDANAEAFRGDWYFTGDKASVDADGYFWFESRADDVITSSAYRIGPFEVESALVQHPAVVEAAVVGKPDPDRTEVVCAFCVLADGHKPSEELTQELQAHVKGVTAPYKYPREIRYAEGLPKTISGKIRRNELRRRLRAEQDS